jgi:hypothetical protein
MTAFTHNYNLGRLGNSGDEVRIVVDEPQLGAIAILAEALTVPRFEVMVTLTKTAATGYRLEYRLDAEVVQACVVTLEPVSAVITRSFSRDLHFIGTGPRRPVAVTELDLSGTDEEVPEEIDNLHYDLAGAALEEFLLGLDPYPRAPGVEFTPAPEVPDAKLSPFAALKSLKSRT